MGSKANYWVNDGRLVDRLGALLQRWQEEAQLGGIAAGGAGGPRAIPRLLHFVWLGPTPLPSRFHRVMDTWQELHPDLQTTIWDDAAAAGLPKANQAAFDAADNMGEKADLLRWEILWQYGGLCVDVDVECLASLETILSSTATFVAGLGNAEAAVEVHTSLVACAPGHPLIQLVLQTCAANSQVAPALPNGYVASRVDLASLAGVMAFLAPDDLQAMKRAQSADLCTRILARTGSGCLTRCLDQYLASTESSGSDPGLIAVFPHTIFSPVPASFAQGALLSSEEACEQLRQAFVSPQALAVHWAQRTWAP